jgi:FKBP-type peptidyl-prolyl cis-trans isomerase FkpA
MKNLILSACLTLVVISFASCLKDDSCMDKTIQSEAGTMQDYAANNGMAVTTHSSGVMYQILNQGTGAVNIDSKVFIRYTGKYLDGTVFDQVTDHTATGWVLGGLIPGWQIGLPLIGEGGHIKLLIPSSLAYGCRGYGPIPGNSILYFEIQLIDVQ